MVLKKGALHKGNVPSFLSSRQDFCSLTNLANLRPMFFFYLFYGLFGGKLHVKLDGTLGFFWVS